MLFPRFPIKIFYVGGNLKTNDVLKEVFYRRLSVHPIIMIFIKISSHSSRHCGYVGIMGNSLNGKIKLNAEVASCFVNPVGEGCS